MPRFVSLVLGWLVLSLFASTLNAEGVVEVEVLEGFPDKPTWKYDEPTKTTTFPVPAFGLIGLPEKYSPKGHILDRSSPHAVRLRGEVTLPEGTYRFLLRSRNSARFFVDGKPLIQTAFIKPNGSGHEKVPERVTLKEKNLTPLLIGHQEKVVSMYLSAGKHEFRLEARIGGKNLRPELGTLFVGIASGKEPFRLLAPKFECSLTPEGWAGYVAAQRFHLRSLNAKTRRSASAKESEYWTRRHELARSEWADQPTIEVPTVSDKAPVFNAIDRFIGKRLEAAGIRPAPLTDDSAFLRRVTLDTLGVIPTLEEIEAFQNDADPDRRAKVIDKLVQEPRWADHWVSYWQDVLAENPGILKPSLNNTGPFRWWLREAFEDNLSMDRFVTELVLMQGSSYRGAPAGFAKATQNDVPMAAKAHVISKAFLGVELQCARCHDGPFRPFKQENTFSLAAMLARKSLKVPKTSTVPIREGARRPSVEITLKPGQSVAPSWPFDDLADNELPKGVLRNASDSRERLAAILTSPRNLRFARVMVNRLWKRYLGWGFVEPVDDWHEAVPSHPELMDYLAREFITHNYDLKHVVKLILNSHTYQRQVLSGRTKPTDPENRLFASPARRRMTAEQLVDSLFRMAGKRFLSEELSMDPEGRRPPTSMLSLGKPQRAWEMTSLSNERDRPALALPVAQSLVDLLVAYGWRDSRPNPITEREETPTPLQPLLLANGVVGRRITRLCDDSTFTEQAMKSLPLDDFVRTLFLQVLSRPPSENEAKVFVSLLQEGYAERKVPGAKRRPPQLAASTEAVSWSNHLSPEATRIKLELERRAREGDPPTKRLNPDWRERAEDAIWALVNSPEFVFLP